MPTISACIQLFNWVVRDTNTDILECLTAAMYAQLITVAEFRECNAYWSSLDFADRLEQMRRFQIPYRGR